MGVKGRYDAAGVLTFHDGAGTDILDIQPDGDVDVKTAGKLKIAGVALVADAAELNALDGVTAGTGAASKALVLDANLAARGYRRVMVSQAADFSVGSSNSQSTYLITGVDKVATLPATVAGLVFTFIVTAAALSAGVGFSISPAAADKIMNNGITSADNKDLINTAATDAEGDTITLVGDGSDGWYVIAQRGIWARET